MDAKRQSKGRAQALQRMTYWRPRSTVYSSINKKFRIASGFETKLGAIFVRCTPKNSDNLLCTRQKGFIRKVSTTNSRRVSEVLVPFKHRIPYAAHYVNESIPVVKTCVTSANTVFQLLITSILHHARLYSLQRSAIVFLTGSWALRFM